MISPILKSGIIVFNLFILLALASFSIRAQNGELDYEPILIDEFGSVGDCDFTGRLDAFLAELSQKPDFHGYVINYKATDELPDERRSNSRETAIANHFEYRNFDRSRITIVRGGYRPQVMTELWIVGPGVNPPQPSKTEAPPIIPERTTLLFASNYLAAHGDESLLDEYVLPAVRQREDAEFEEMKREAEGPVDSTEPAEAPKTGDVQSESEHAEPYVDQRTEEEKDAEKFLWTNVGVGKFITERKGSTGVIIFYADDERYDIKKMRHLLEAGRDRLAKQADIKSDRLKIRFGGYRESSEVEFWFVPSKGKAPQARPEERPVPEPENTDAGTDPSS